MTMTLHNPLANSRPLAFGLALLAAGLVLTACLPGPVPVVPPGSTVPSPATPPPTIAPAPTTTAPVSVKSRLRGVRTWAFALGDNLSGDAFGRLSRFGLVVLDSELASAELVRRLEANGTIVIAYLSVGTIEKNRSWTARADAYRLDYWPDFDEYYADPSQVGFRDLISQTVVPPLMSKGFNGVFLDNTDMIGSHAAQAVGMRQLVTTLAQIVHGSGGVLFSQNGAQTIGPMLGDLDGWNREDVTWTYDFSLSRYVPRSAEGVVTAQAELRLIESLGLFVTATDYVDTNDASATRKAVSNACAAGAIPWVADIGLTRYPTAPYQC